MVTIRELLRDVGARVVDHRLSWGARESDYATELREARNAGLTAVLIELSSVGDPTTNDHGLHWSLLGRSSMIRAIDHHGPRAGSDCPSSLRQVFEYLALDQREWPRWYTLVEANDIGHIVGMRAIGATDQEIRHVRIADLRAQGATYDDFEAAAEAITSAVQSGGGTLVVRLPHEHASVAGDLLHPLFGHSVAQPIRLVVRTPNRIVVTSDGDTIRRLCWKIPGGWWGGSLPERGFWGIMDSSPRDGRLGEVLTVVEP